MFELLLYYIIKHEFFSLLILMSNEDKNVNVAHMKLQKCLFDLQCGVIRDTTPKMYLKVQFLIFIGVFILFILGLF